MPHLQSLRTYPIKWLAGLFAVGLVFCGGCSLSDVQLPWQKLPVQPVTTHASPDEMLPPGALIRRSLATRARFQTLHAKAGMRIIDKAADFGLSVNTELWAGAGPDRLRIYATKASVEAFDAVVAGDEVMMYVKRRRTLYRGTLEDLENESAVHFSPQDILENLLQPDIHLSARTWKIRHARKSIRGVGTVIVLEEVKAGKHWKAYIEPTSHLLLLLEQLDARGRVEFRKRYDRYRQLLQPAAVGNGTVERWYPFTIELAWPKEKRNVTIKFRTVDPNVTLSPEDFLLAVPERVRTKSIGEARIESDKDGATEKETKQEK